MYDVIIVGAGTAGLVAARELAEKQNKKVLIVEKKHHIAGNCYDEKDEHGILIHVYGPHIFHTGKEKVFEYLSRFTEWYAFGHEVGDEIIKKLSTHVIEKIKNKPHTKLVRYGGDEFILITYGIKYTDFINMCNEIHREIQNEKLDNINKKITLSIGVSNSLMEKSLDFFDLKDNADKKLYIAKNNGKNIIIC